jgi:hypothetical protein
MPYTPLHPPIADLAPTDSVLTSYDEQLKIVYLRLLDADAENADWREVARTVLQLDPDKNPDKARRTWESHLARAHWMTKVGYQFLLRGGAPH